MKLMTQQASKAALGALASVTPNNSSDFCSPDAADTDASGPAAGVGTAVGRKGLAVGVVRSGGATKSPVAMPKITPPKRQTVVSKPRKSKLSRGGRILLVTAGSGTVLLLTTI